MLGKSRVINPHYPDSPARMADGRLFTDYRGNCKMLGAFQMGGDTPAIDASFDRKERMQHNGATWRHTDRMLTTGRGGSLSCTDTMVPELTKRVCTWNGCTTLPGHAAGIGQGRLFLPGRPDLAAADPDKLAAATAFEHGTFSANPTMYMVGPLHGLVEMQQVEVTPARKNRYSVPYGN